MFGDIHLFEQVHGALALFSQRISPGKIHRQHDVLEHGQSGQKLKGLEDHAHRLAAQLGSLFGAEAMQRSAVDPDLSGGGAIQPGDHVDQSGLAAAGFSGDDQELTRIDLQVNAVQGSDRAGQAVVDLDHVPQIDQRLSLTVHTAVRRASRYLKEILFNHVRLRRLANGW